MQAAQNKPDTNKADEASPFAMLMEATASKDAGKASQKDAHSSDDRKDADKPSVKKDSKADTQQAQAKPAARQEKTDKVDKSDKSDDKTAKADDAAKDEGAPTDQAAAPQPVNPQAQQATQALPAAANDDEYGADEIAAAGEVQDAKPAAAQNNAPAPQDQDPVEDAQAAAGKALAAKPAAPAKPAKPDTKTDGAKAAKANAADTADAKADAQAAARTDAKTDAVNAALNDKAAAPHDAGRPANADTNMAVHSLNAPQGQQTAQANAPVLTQHVQVAQQQQPTPNVPALAVQIAAKSQSGAKQFDIRLDPPELGRVEVRLSIDATGKASAHLSADQPQTLDLLQKDAPALTRALREAGLDVSQDGLNFSLRHGQENNSGNGGARGFSRGFSLTATSTIDATATSAAYRSVADGRLDIRV